MTDERDVQYGEFAIYFPCFVLLRDSKIGTSERLNVSPNTQFVTVTTPDGDALAIFTDQDLAKTHNESLKSEFRIAEIPSAKILLSIIESCPLNLIAIDPNQKTQGASALEKSHAIEDLKALLNEG